ncbi:hypothetical protein BKA70DRAFT_1398735 [Coprinopsis sp. MPI-PUGE-AT-0042]|nr:hypothetical protein BKA70DRAFT_1398735 [Coprinopsis sp. MPI-PUGE-AT-0042]
MTVTGLVKGTWLVILGLMSKYPPKSREDERLAREKTRTVARRPKEAGRTALLLLGSHLRLQKLSVDQPNSSCQIQWSQDNRIVPWRLTPEESLQVTAKYHVRSLQLGSDNRSQYYIVVGEIALERSGSSCRLDEELFVCSWLDMVNSSDGLLPGGSMVGADRVAALAPVDDHGIDLIFPPDYNWEATIARRRRTTPRAISCPFVNAIHEYVESIWEATIALFYSAIVGERCLQRSGHREGAIEGNKVTTRRCSKKTTSPTYAWQAPSRGSNYEFKRIFAGGIKCGLWRLVLTLPTVYDKEAKLERGQSSAVE